MGIKFINNEKKALRLDGTVCLYEGEPVYVSTRSQRFDDRPLDVHEVYATYLRKKNSESPKTGQYFRVDYTVDSFIYFGLELGYMNYNNSTYYLSRDPSRTQSAGLSSGNVDVPRGVDRYGIFVTREFGDAVMGDHPKFTEALDKVTSLDREAIAFDRNYALSRVGSKRIFLEHSGYTIGIKSRKSDQFILFGGNAAKAYVPDLQNHGVSFTIDDNL